MTLSDSPAIPAYFDLLKKCLTDTLREELYRPLLPQGAAKQFVAKVMQAVVAPTGLDLVKRVRTESSRRHEGKDWPAHAETMIGLKRLDQLQACVEQVLRDDVPGDFIECGAWRGGATIFMRAMLQAYGDPARRVWVADSFEGLPRPNVADYPQDTGDLHHTWPQLAISLETVQANFARYNLLDDRVKFLKGWFSDTLANAPVDRLSVLRADGDMYESTIQILDALYPRLSVGGYCIIDDWGAVPACKQATQDYRGKHGITEEIHMVDWSGAWWRRER